MTWRLAVASLWLATLVCSGCLGPLSLHEVILSYDQLVSRLEYEILLVNIGRLRNGLPVHFTVTSSIAATFDYQTSAAILGAITDLGLSVGANAAENPTLTIVPIQWSSCGSCHLDGLSDGVTWLFSAGPRQTIPSVSHKITHRRSLPIGEEVRHERPKVELAFYRGVLDDDTLETTWGVGVWSDVCLKHHPDDSPALYLSQPRPEPAAGAIRQGSML